MYVTIYLGIYLAVHAHKSGDLIDSASNCLLDWSCRDTHSLLYYRTRPEYLTMWNYEAGVRKVL